MVRLRGTFWWRKEGVDEESRQVRTTSARVKTVKPITDRSIFFIHIPKTGGTTLRDLIEQRFEPHVLCPDIYMMLRSGGCYPPTPWYLSIPDDQFGQIRLLRGHLHFLAHTRFPERPFITTIFREPMERTISEMRYRVRIEGKPLEAEIEAVEAVVRDGVPEYLNNVQTKYFRGEYELDDLSRDRIPGLEAPVTMPEFDRARAARRFPRSRWHAATLASFRDGAF